MTQLGKKLGAIYTEKKHIFYMTFNELTFQKKIHNV